MVTWRNIFGKAVRITDNPNFFDNSECNPFGKYYLYYVYAAVE